MLSRADVEAVLREYPNLSPVSGAHLSRRLRRCPYDEVTRHLPPQGTVLDIGCGYGHFGVYLSLHAPQLRYVGCDPDPRKIAVARTARPGAPGGPCRFHLGPCEEVEDMPDSLAGIVILDVLYLMPKERQRAVLAWAAQRLAAGGALVVKTIDPTKGWRSLMVVAQEWVMVRLLLKTYSSGEFAAALPPAMYVSWLSELRLETEWRELPANRTPALLLVARKG